MSDFYDAETHDEYCEAMQLRINNGSIWTMEGSAGREAMGLIEAGYCLLGEIGHRDYYGNYIPGRSEVKAGTKGSYEYVVKRTNVAWAARMKNIPGHGLSIRPAVRKQATS